jgi:hypothetical protein
LTHKPLGNASLTVGSAPIALATFFPAGHTGGAWSCVFVSLAWNQGARWAPLRTCPRHFFQTVKQARYLCRLNKSWSFDLHAHPA